MKKPTNLHASAYLWSKAHAIGSRKGDTLGLNAKV